MRARHAFYGGVEEQTSEKDAPSPGFSRNVREEDGDMGNLRNVPPQPEPRQRGCRLTDIFCRWSLVDFAVLDVTFIACTV